MINKHGPKKKVSARKNGKKICPLCQKPFLSEFTIGPIKHGENKGSHCTYFRHEWVEQIRREAHAVLAEPFFEAPPRGAWAFYDRFLEPVAVSALCTTYLVWALTAAAGVLLPS